MSLWKAEQVRFGDLRPNSPFYLDNPIECPNAPPHHTGSTPLPDDTPVWTLFEPWSRYNPWLKREVNGPIGELSDLGMSLIGLDEHLRSS